MIDFNRHHTPILIVAVELSSEAIEAAIRALNEVARASAIAAEEMIALMKEYEEAHEYLYVQRYDDAPWVGIESGIPRRRPERLASSYG